MNKCSLFLFGFLSLFFTSQAMAQNVGVSDLVITDHAESQLIAETTSIAPGQTITLLFNQKLQKGWHVYWKNPGDSGLPLTMNWGLSSGFDVGAVAYPTPHKIPVDVFVNYGFEGRPGFLVELTAPVYISPGTMMTVSLDAEWLICELVCVPESGHFELSLPITAQDGMRNSQWALRFRQVRESLPKPAPFEAIWFADDQQAGLMIKDKGLQAAESNPDLYFFADKINLIKPSAPQRVRTSKEGYPVLLFSTGDDFDPASQAPLSGVLSVADGKGYELSAPHGPFPDIVSPEKTSTPPSAAMAGVVSFIFLAFLGGILLNIMPCVFPVIFIKAANLAETAQQDRARVRRHGFAYTAGVLATFFVLAGLLLLLRAGGAQLGWGFQLQSPGPNAIFALIIFLIGLNLAGVFQMGTSLQGVGSGLTAHRGVMGSFFTGLLAVAVAAPCIGPLLGAPIGFALAPSIPAWVGMAVFMAIGLGLALPYLLISLMPGLARLLPKPGPWMETFKQWLSFAMFATLIWLAWVIVGQAGPNGVIGLGLALLLAALAAWSYGKSQKRSEKLGFWKILALLALLLSTWSALSLRTAPTQMATLEAGDIHKQAWSPVRLQELRAEGRPVFIDFTAKWCVTCQVNEVTVLQRKEAKRLFREKQVVLLVADWTSYNPAITEALASYGRAGVPLYVFYAPGADEPVILPQILSLSILRETFAVVEQ